MSHVEGFRQALAKYPNITVLADNHGGRRLNSPNDVVAHRDGSYWFTDPPYGGQLYEGEAEDYFITVVIPPDNDAGIASITSPSFPACVLDSNISVLLQNYGQDTL